MDLGIASTSTPDPNPGEENASMGNDDKRDLVDDKLCRARMNSLTKDVADLKDKIDWANRLIILTLLAVIGEMVLMMKGYIL